MQVQFELVIGENKFTLIETVENNSEFFQKLHFYSTLPKVGPNGETDLVLTFRVAQGQYEYYSIVSKKAGQEYKFGQSKKNDGSLFGKGWEPLYSAGQEEGREETSTPTTGLGAAPTTGLGSPAPAQQTTAKQATSTKPTPAPAAASTSNGTNPNPQVQNQAKNILAKFGV